MTTTMILSVFAPDPRALAVGPHLAIYRWTHPDFDPFGVSNIL
jgi:hypothetical protein